YLLPGAGAPLAASGRPHRAHDRRHVRRDGSLAPRAAGLPPAAQALHARHASRHPRRRARARHVRGAACGERVRMTMTAGPPLTAPPDPLATLREYRSLAPWGLRDLAALAAGILDASGVVPVNAAARARPSERTIR